ncbi:hypothetical protein B296_00011647 [Ensete ventricosum]|uniref:Uncharacterized protein n=1 Tax=Ensete ventricosum TaxID=4639 RepID=A0A427AR00_ENSVE|nr:hypothetical protein B296_00011647 [Ensete ventricosum]
MNSKSLFESLYLIYKFSIRRLRTSYTSYGRTQKHPSTGKAFRVGRGVLPKFFLEEVGFEGFEVVRRGRRRVCGVFGRGGGAGEGVEGVRRVLHRVDGGRRRRRRRVRRRQAWLWRSCSEMRRWGGGRRSCWIRRLCHFSSQVASLLPL